MSGAILDARLTLIALWVLCSAIPVFGALVSMWVIAVAARHRRYWIVAVFVPVAVVAMLLTLVLLTPYPEIEIGNPN